MTISRCSICHTDVEYLGQGYYRYEKSGSWARAQQIRDVFVCSKACKSQYVYSQATPKEQEMFRCLAQVCEMSAGFRNLALWRKEDQHAGGLRTSRLAPNEGTTYAKYFDAGDLFDLYELLQVAGLNLAGDGSMDSPEWYTQAVAQMEAA